MHHIYNKPWFKPLQKWFWEPPRPDQLCREDQMYVSLPKGIVEFCSEIAIKINKTPKCRLLQQLVQDEQRSIKMQMETQM